MSKGIMRLDWNEEFFGVDWMCMVRHVRKGWEWTITTDDIGWGGSAPSKAEGIAAVQERIAHIKSFASLESLKTAFCLEHPEDCQTISFEEALAMMTKR